MIPFAVDSAQGNVVATERLDRWDFTGSGSWELELPAVGMFDVTEDGKISGWRDFFDNQLWFGKGGPRLHLEFDK